MQLSIPSSFLLHNGLLGRGWQRLYWQSPAILWCFCPWTLPIFVIFSRCLIGPVPRTWDLPSVGFLGPQDRKEWRPGRPHIVSHRSLPGFHLSGFCITSVALVMLVGFLAPFTSCRMASRYLSSLFLPPSVAQQGLSSGKVSSSTWPPGTLAWNHFLASVMIHRCSSILNKVRSSCQQSAQVGQWVWKMDSRGLISTKGFSDYEEVKNFQLRRSVMKKAW